MKINKNSLEISIIAIIIISYIKPINIINNSIIEIGFPMKFININIKSLMLNNSMLKSSNINLLYILINIFIVYTIIEISKKIIKSNKIK